MKKIAILTILFMPFIVFANDDVSLDGFVEPEWKDFAPVAYVNIQEPKGIGKFNDTIAYWYKRKVEFDKNIEKCRETTPNELKIACYQDLKVKQYQKNSDYNARIEAMERERMNPQLMQDPTTNMFPIGNGMFNNFGKFQPNEFN